MPVYKRNPQGIIVKDNEEGCWYYDFVIEGRRYKKALVGIRTRKQAEKIEEKKRFAVYSGDDLNKLGNITFEQFVKEVYLPYQQLRIRNYYKYERYCMMFYRFFGKKTLREIENDPDMIDRFLRQRRNAISCRGAQVSPGTVNHDKAVLSGIFSLAIKKKYCKSNPCRGIAPLPNVNGRRTAVFQPEDEARLLEALSGKKEKYRPVVILGLYTGMRLSEILNLRWEWIDLGKREVTLPASVTKNKKPRTILLNSEALNALAEALHTHQDTKRVFPNTRGIGFGLRHVSGVIATTCDEIGLPDVTMHATRRTFNTRLIERNVNPLHVKELMGHSSLDMTDYYTNLSRESMREAVNTLEKQHHNASAVPEQ